MNIDGYERLAAAVVRQAVKDYEWALRRLHRKPHDLEAGRTVDDCEQFFQNEIAIYSDLDGVCIMNKIREKVDQEMRH